MKQDIFENSSNPFTVPDGYFDSLQERIMNRIRAEDNHLKVERRIIGITPFRTLVAAAACILLIFTAVTLYTTHSNKKNIVAEYVVDEDFYRWFYTSDGTALLAESLDITAPDNSEFDYSEKDEAIIRFLERENINLVAIVHSVNNETYFH